MALVTDPFTRSRKGALEGLLLPALKDLHCPILIIWEGVTFVLLEGMVSFSD